MSLGRISSLGPCSLMRPAAITTILSAISRIRSWCEMMSMEPFISSYIFSKTLMRFEKLQRSMPGLRLVENGELRAPREDGGYLDALELAAGEAGVDLAVYIIPRAHADAAEVVAGLADRELAAGGQAEQVVHRYALEAHGLLEGEAYWPFLARSVTPRPVMSSPSRIMLPDVGFIMPAMMRARVLLPPPFGAGYGDEALAHREAYVVEYLLFAVLVRGGVGYVTKFKHRSTSLKAVVVYFM